MDAKDNLTRPPEAQHEERDVNVRFLARFGVALIVGGVAVMFLIGYLFQSFSEREAAESPKPHLGINAREMRLPPEPRLQTDAPRELGAMHEAEQRVLSHYAWVDPDHGIIRIPIDRAIELLAQKNLPYRSGALESAAAGNVSMPTESGLGQIMAPAGGPLADKLPAPSEPHRPPLVAQGMQK